MSSELLLRIFFSGLTRGSIYALLALGYTMVYGIIRLINFAHGDIYMLGAFSALIAIGVCTVLNLPLFAIILCAVLLAVLSAAAYSFTIEKIAYAPLRTAPRLSALISAIGVSMFLQNYVQLAQTSDFLPFLRLFELGGGTEKESLFSVTQGVIFGVTTLIMVLLTLFVQFTRTGKSMRALAQDRVMAMLVGVNIDRIISTTFIIGSSTAAIGGVLISAYVGQLNFYVGFVVGIKAFVAAVLGGVGSIPGAVLGSFILGLTESFGTSFISSDYEDVFAFLLLILILVFKPSGLLGKSTKEKV